jgi:uncharacterized protein (DUF1697 family)
MTPTGSVACVTKYVALLRGVNVGGITVRSAELADMARGLGLDDVRTVLASGNLTFTSPDRTRIGAGLRERHVHTPQPIDWRTTWES